MALRDFLTDLAARNEKQLTQFAAELLSNERFTDALVTALEMATQARNQVDGRLQGVYHSLNLPDRRQFEAVADKVKELSKILSDLDTRLSRLGREVAEKLDAADGKAELEAQLAEKDKEVKSAERKIKNLEKKVKDLEAAAAGAGGQS